MYPELSTPALRSRFDSSQGPLRATGAGFAIPDCFVGAGRRGGIWGVGGLEVVAGYGFVHEVLVESSRVFNSRLVAVTGGEVRAMGLLMFGGVFLEGLDGLGGLVGSMGTWLWYRVHSGGLFLWRGRELARWYWY